MKASVGLLSAVVAVCLGHCAATAQQPYRPDPGIPSNWQPGPGGTRPAWPSGQVGLPGPRPSPLPGTTPPEPIVQDFIGGNGPPANAPVPISPQDLEKLITPPEPPKFSQFDLPPYARPMPQIPVRQESFEVPSWLWWGIPVILLGAGAAGRATRKTER